MQGQQKISMITRASFTSTALLWPISRHARAGGGPISDDGVIFSLVVDVHFGAQKRRLCPIQANRTAWQQYLELATFTTLFEMPVANWLTYPTVNFSETLGWPTDRLGGYVRKSHSYPHARRGRRAAAAVAATTTALHRHTRTSVSTSSLLPMPFKIRCLGAVH